MAKIINFPVPESTGFKNLKQLFDVACSVQGCDFYLGTAEEMAEHGSITKNELLTLRRIGRQKRYSLMID